MLKLCVQSNNLRFLKLIETCMSTFIRHIYPCKKWNMYIRNSQIQNKQPLHTVKKQRGKRRMGLYYDQFQKRHNKQLTKVRTCRVSAHINRVHTCSLIEKCRPNYNQSPKDRLFLIEWTFFLDITFSPTGNPSLVYFIL